MTPRLSAARRAALLAPAAAAALALLTAGSLPGQSPPGRAADRTDEVIRLNNLGIAYLAQYKPAEAEKQFRQALAIDPRYVPGHVNAGIAALAQVHYEDAIAAFRKALELDPASIHAHFNLSMIGKLQGRPAEALVEGQKALALDPRDPDIRYHVGSLHVAQRDFDKAIQEFEAVLRLDPNFLSAYYSLGRAYISKGDMEKGKQYIEKHRELQAGAGATPAVGLRYGEQGKYSFAMEDLGPASGLVPPLEAGRVTLVDVSAGSGLSFEHQGSGGYEALRRKGLSGDEARRYLEETLLPALGSGVAVGDVDGDGREDLFFPNAGADGKAPSALYLNQGGMRFAAAPGRPSIAATSLSAAFGDMDGDGDLDLVAGLLDRVVLHLNDGKGRFRDATEESRLASVRAQGALGGIVLADVDHDGDLDIHAAGLLSAPASGQAGPFPQGWPGAPGLLLLNTGGPPSDGVAPAPTFAEKGKASRLDHGGRRATGGVFGDFDNDRDIDLALASPADGSTLYSNLRDGTFGDLGRASGLPTAASIIGLASGDYNKDGWMDLAATTLDGGPPKLFRNMLGQIPGASSSGGAGLFALDVSAIAELTTQVAVPRFGVAFADVDNDGYLDLLSVNGETEGPALFVSRNNGEGGFTDAGPPTGADAVRSRGGRGLAVADLDQDGDLDVVITNAGGRPTLLRNDGGNKGNWIRVAPSGLHSNRPGVGTKIEVKAGRLWQKIEVQAGSGYLSQSSLIPHFGLGPRGHVDTLRLLWPGGVLQDEVQVKAGEVFAVQELDRKGSSCPILYAWNGREMAFVSDFLGGAALGYRTGSGAFNHPDTDEYVPIEGSRLREKDGRLEIRMVNQLEETIFFDRARLLAVDHPADTEVLPDEKLLPGPPFQPFRTFSIRGARPPAAALDDAGRDVLDVVSARDRRYAGPAGRPAQDGGRRFRGYAEEHRLTLDLGPLPDGGPALLVLYGWIDYADSTSNVAASQAGLTLTPPYLEALDESDRSGPDVVATPSGTRRGRWVRPLPSIGFPGGLPKAMTVDLTGRLPAGTRLVRIGTSMRIFWDEVRVADAWGPPPVLTAVEASSAVLRFRGFPALRLPDGQRPEEYDYARDEPSVHWKGHVGLFTRHGDVRELLAAVDDRYVITRPGDEVAAVFPAASLPPLPPGWRRDYLLHADGFGKDMDVHSARPDGVFPLPWHAMSAYPPPAGEGFPFEREGMMEWFDLYNTRAVTAPLAPLSPPSRSR